MPKSIELDGIWRTKDYNDLCTILYKGHFITMKDFKLGDLVENGWASVDNPNRILLFIRQTNTMFIFVNAKGYEVKIRRSDREALMLAGTIDLTGWREMVENRKEMKD